MYRNFILVTICLLISFLWACSQDKDVNSASETDTIKLQTQKVDTSSFDLQKVDINNDGRVDQFFFTKDGVIQYAQRDFNFDTLIDMSEFYENGVHVRDEIDLDYDGVCDLIVTYQNDKPIKKEYSVDFEANRHGTLIFDANGNKIEVHRDTNTDGTVDVIEYYKPNANEPYKIQKKE